MLIKKTKLAGAYLIETERHSDHRGYFTTTFCRKEFTKAGLVANFVQSNCSFNIARGTLRGMHFQVAPMAQPKLVRCTRGAVYDVMIDLRPESPTYCQWVAAELTEDNGSAFYIPEGFAHGFETMADNSEVFYEMGEFYSPEHGKGFRWNDPAFSIHWPIASPILAARDANYPGYVR